MEYYGIFGAIIVALFLTLIFSAAFNNKGPWGALWVVFLIIFLASWAGHLWIHPIGPVILGITWVPLLFVGFIFAFLLAAAVAASPKRVSEDDENVPLAAAIIGTFFWFLILILVISIVVGYYREPPAIELTNRIP